MNGFDRQECRNLIVHHSYQRRVHGTELVRNCRPFGQGTSGNGDDSANHVLGARHDGQEASTGRTSAWSESKIQGQKSVSQT